MKKKLCLPLTARPHRARMQILIKELEKHFELDIWEPKERNGDMSVNSILYAIEFNNYLSGKNFDGIIIRGDRYEMLGLSMVAVYKGFKIIHIEGGDLSGDVIDSKVRHSITHLSDFHFATNKEAHQRLIAMGISPERVWNFGSLDTEYADSVKLKKIKDQPFILVAYHPIFNEDETELDKALENFKDNVIIKIGSNKDTGRTYGEEQFSPEDYINLMRGAKVLVGNSSSLIKEASILKKGVVLIGNRQSRRFMPHNVVQVPCKVDNIIKAILYQMQNKYDKDLTYYKPNTSKEICQQLKKILQE